MFRNFTLTCDSCNTPNTIIDTLYQEIIGDDEGGITISVTLEANCNTCGLSSSHEEEEE